VCSAAVVFRASRRRLHGAAVAQRKRASGASPKTRAGLVSRWLSRADRFASRPLRADGYSWAEIGSRSASSARPLSDAGDNVASPAVPHTTRPAASHGHRRALLSLELWV